MNTEEVHHLESIKHKVEKMTKSNQLEILKILNNHKNIKLNENKSGVYVNLSFLTANIVKEIETYIEYVNAQEDSLKSIEIQKDQFKSTFFMDNGLNPYE
jgi:hypothetical protein